LEAMSPRSLTMKRNLPPPLVIHPHMADIVISEEHRVVSISRSINSIGSGREAMLSVPSPDRIVIVRSPAEECQVGRNRKDVGTTLPLEAYYCNKTDSPVEEALPSGHRHLAPPRAPMMNSAVFPPNPSVSSFEQSIHLPKSVSPPSFLLYISYG
jgi:hypothetical protein